MHDTQPLYLLTVECYEFVDDGWPPWVKARLVDADGNTWHFAEKTPMFFDQDEPTGSTPLPVMGNGRCEILQSGLDSQGNEILVVRAEVEAIEDDICEFRVRPEQIAGRWNA
ncbi:hypothetical protein [Rhizocola hellebori]|nr:hypothetical protein [Rhizocola hellebori]